MAKNANLMGRCEIIALFLLLLLFVADIMSKKGLFALVVFSIFKLTYPTPTTNVR